MAAAVEAGAPPRQPHAVVVPYPAQGHVTPMLQLAILLHRRGFYISYVNTHYNHRRLLRSRGPHALDGLHDFRFHAIPDGMPFTDGDATQDIPSLCHYTSTTCHLPFLHLLRRLNAPHSGVPPVTCIISDGVMSFTLDAADHLSLPVVLFWTPSASGMLCYTHYPALIERGITPFKDSGDLFNGYMETILDWIPGTSSIRLRDIPTFIRTTDPDDIMLNFYKREVLRIPRASAVILNTFQSLEGDALDALSAMIPCRVYSVGPLQLLLNQTPPNVADDSFETLGSNLWKEQPECLEWLDTKDPRSVVYVNFGSITVMSPHQLTEFAWGLARTDKAFLWIIRPDLVAGEAAILPPEFLRETEGRGMLARWCRQDEVLKHSSVGVFLTHSGWNSTVESVVGGVPVICWPFFAEQSTNCFYSCRKWGVGMEIEGEVKREVVEAIVREMMDGEKGREKRRRAEEWKQKAAEATGPGGSSSVNMDEFVAQLLEWHHGDDPTD